MELKQAAAILAAGTLTFTTTASVWAEVPQATEQTSDYDVLSLPVQILDFNRDNLFFEYDYLDNGGMNFITEGEDGSLRYTATTDADGNLVLNEDGTPKQVAYADGLVAPDHLANGAPVYTDAARAAIARSVADALTSYAHGEDTLFSKIAANIVTGKTIEYAGALGTNDEADTTLMDDWQTYAAPEGMQNLWNGTSLIQTAENSNDLKMLWQFKGPDELHFAPDCTAALERELAVEPGDYIFSRWAQNGATAEVTIGDKTYTLNDTNQTVTVPEGTTIAHLRVYKTEEDTEDPYLTALRFYKADTQENNLFSWDNDRAEQRAWTCSAAGFSAVEKDGCYTGHIGKMLWHRETDGAICDDAAAPLRRAFTVNPGGSCTLSYWTNSGDTCVSLLADDREFASHQSTGNGGAESFSFTVPENADEITVSITTAAGAKVADMKLTAAGTARLDGVDTPATGSWQTDVLENTGLSARAYTTFMLDHLFVPTAGLNTQVTAYDNLVLLRQEDGSYLFDSEKPIVYDTTNKALYNDENGENRGGFFPVDGLGFNETTQTQFSGTPEVGHNYHFTLHSGGTFVYKADKDLYFDFSGDDDVYLFINDKLALDLGGAHLKAAKSIHLNELADQLGLNEGETCKFDFFYMERHTDASNLRISTNIDVQRRVDDDDARVIQNVKFVLDSLEIPPEELYVQAYRDGQPYDSPMKFTPAEPARRLELAGGHDYTFKLLTDVSDYLLTTDGDLLTETDVKDVEKTWIYTLRPKSTPTPTPAPTKVPSVKPGSSQNHESGKGSAVTKAAPAATARPTAAAVMIPRTEDTSHPVLLGILCVTGAFGFGVVYARKKYRR